MESIHLPTVLERLLNYAQSLRCIGQDLESLNLRAVELKYQGGAYLIQGWYKGTSSSVDLEKRYTPDDLNKMDKEAKTRRRHLGRMSNPFSLSEVFRFAGQYVDRISGRLIRISWQNQSEKIQSVTIQYDACDNEQKEPGESKVSTIDEICIHIYKQKKKIAGTSEKYIYRQSAN
jgi:hypothetical protein